MSLHERLFIVQKASAELREVAARLGHQHELTPLELAIIPRRSTAGRLEARAPLGAARNF